MPVSLPSLYVARAQGDTVPFNLVCFGGPWVLAQVFDHGFEKSIANESYTLRGLTLGHSVSGTTDEDGVLYEDRLPFDEYEISCKGATERVPLYTDEMRSELIQPWAVRMRAIEAQEDNGGGGDRDASNEGDE